MPSLDSGDAERTVTMMSAALRTTLTPTPHLAVLHQQRLYIVSALSRTHIILDGVRARLNATENALSQGKRQPSLTTTTDPSAPSPPDCSYNSSRASSSTLCSDARDTRPESRSSQIADNQPHNNKTRLSRAARKKLQHIRWCARGTVRNCAAEESALLESLRTVQDRILHLQDAALRNSTVGNPMAQTEFCNPSWFPGWNFEFGDQGAQLGYGDAALGWGPGPTDFAPRKSSYMVPSGAPRSSFKGAGKQRTISKADTWGNSSIMSNGSSSTTPIINAQLVPIGQAYPQLQLTSPNNQAQIPLQAPYTNPFLFSPGIPPSPLYLDSETTAEDLYEWENGQMDPDDPYDQAVDPSSTLYNAPDPYYSFSYSPNSSFSFPTADENDNNAQPTQYANALSPENNQPPPCASPFPEQWDLAQALRVGRSANRTPSPPPTASAAPDEDDGAVARGRRRHVRQLSAMLSPRGSRVWHIDDLVPPEQQDPLAGATSSSSSTPRSALFPPSRKPSAAEGSSNGLARVEVNVASWTTTVEGSANAKGKGRALDPMSPTFVPGSGYFGLTAAAAPATTATPPPPPTTTTTTTAPKQKLTVDVKMDSVVSSAGASHPPSFSAAGGDSGSGSGADSAVEPSKGGDKRRYSAAAVDLLLNRFKENAANPNPIKKRRSWKRGRGASASSAGSVAGALLGGMGAVMGSVGEEGTEEICVMMEVA